MCKHGKHFVSILPGSIPSVLGELRGAKIVTFFTTTLLKENRVQIIFGNGAIQIGIT